MYSKKVVVLNELNDIATMRGKQLSGIVKAVASGEDCKVVAQLTNYDASHFGAWYITVKIDGVIKSLPMDSLNGYSFNVPSRSADSLQALIIKEDNKFLPVAYGASGRDIDYNSLMRDFMLWKNPPKEASTNKGNKASYTNFEKTDEVDTTEYEKFVAATDNYYSGKPINIVDIEEIKNKNNDKFSTVEKYSEAFEKYYAVGLGDNYYASVKNELMALLEQFPPYKPLSAVYPESFWVKIDFPKSSNYFVLGLLLKDTSPKYICYGLPDNNHALKDKDFVYCEGAGGNFWILFQDA
ncbi:MAG: hypothetical protein RR291_00045, partial [Clostridia bacterium]